MGTSMAYVDISIALYVAMEGVGMAYIILSLVVKLTGSTAG